jgi:hypothetical protein
MFATRSLAVTSIAVFAGLAAGHAKPADAKITINTSTASDWKISNGVITLDWSSTTGHIFGVHLAGHTDNLVDTTNTQSGQPKGLYSGNVGTNLGTGSVTAGFHQNGDHYLDWWITTASSSTNAFTYTQHFVIADNDPGVHVYFVAQHGASDIAGSIVQVQWIFRLNKKLFTSTYSVDSGLHDTGPTTVSLPSFELLTPSDSGRMVQDATMDVHGLDVPAGFEREFYTKYDYSSEEYLHRAHGVFGSTFGAWTVIGSPESMVGGPSKQNLIFTGNILMVESMSNHLDNGLLYTPAAGEDSTRLWGPYYIRLNTLDATHTTPAALYQDALGSAAGLTTFYDGEGILAQNGYVASTRRGTLSTTIAGGGSATANTAWVVLSDNKTNMQYSTIGRQYWQANPSSGAVTLGGVAPGTYRLTGYVLGQWGELRKDDVTVTANATTAVPLRFTPENFGTAPPIWTIGTPDRSAREFRHGTNDLGKDDRQYWGNWDYWNDFAGTSGAVVYFATAVGSTRATNDLDQWNYVHWHTFNPGLFGGAFDAADDTTDGYKFLCPAFVGNCATASVPPWQVHFATTAAQSRQGRFVTLSIGLAATESNLTVSLNGTSLTWPGFKVKNADAQVRSGLAGTYQWVVFQFDTSKLSATGKDNVLTLNTDHAQGVMYDALRMEITGTSGAPATTGWHDYEFVDASGYVPANDGVSSN